MTHKPVAIQPVPDDRLIEYEHSLDGAIPVAPLTVALFIPNRTFILTNPRLDVWRPTGAELADTALSRRVAGELTEMFGGWFTEDVAPFVRLYHDFYSDSIRAYLARYSSTSWWGAGQGPFYFAACRVDEWQVQAFGRLGDLHAIFLAREIDHASAVDTLSRLERLRQLDTLLRRAVPRLDMGALQPQDPATAPDPTGLIPASSALRDDLILTGPGITVRSGIRRRVPASRLEEPTVLQRDHLYGRGTTPDDTSLFHGVRITVDLASRR